MPENILPTTQLLSIREASEKIGVSIKTLRRWEKYGLVHPIRNELNQRQFSLAEIENLDNRKFKPLPENSISPQNYLSISQAADQVGVSVKTLRRWDADGKLTLDRDELNRRIFTPEIIKQIKSSKSDSLSPPKGEMQSDSLAERVTGRQAKKPSEHLSHLSLPVFITPFLPILPFFLVALPILIFAALGYKPSTPLQSVKFPNPQSLNTPNSPIPLQPLDTASGSGQPANPILSRLPRGEVAGITVTGGSLLSFENILDDNYNFGVAGTVEGNQIIATTTVKPPLVVTSSEKVANLNADLLDGHSWEEIVAEATVTPLSESDTLQTAFDAGNSISTSALDIEFNLTGPAEFVVDGPADFSGDIAVGGTVDGVDLSAFSPYFITSSGNSGEVWKSDGTGTGYWAAGGVGSTYTGSTGVTLSGTDFQHSDTSSLASVNNSGITVIQDLTLDTFGHLTGVVSVDIASVLTGWDQNIWDDITFSNMATAAANLLSAWDQDSSNDLTTAALGVTVQGYNANTSILGSSIEESEITIGNTPVNGYVLQTDGSGNLVWADPTILTGGANYWLQSNEQIYPKNANVFDLLIGGNSTASSTIALQANTGNLNALSFNNIVSAAELSLLDGRSGTLLDTTALGVTVQGYNANTSLLGSSIEESEITIGNTPVNGYVLQTDGSGNLVWADPSSMGTNFWTQTGEQIYPSNSLWTDILVGGNSSASAKIVLEAATGYIKANNGDFQTLSGGNLNLSGNVTTDSLYLRDTNQSNTLQLNWNDNDTNDHVLNLSVVNGDRYLTLGQNFTVGGTSAGTVSFTNPGTLTVAASTQLNQNLLTTSSPTFNGLSLTNLNSNLIPSGNSTLDLGSDLAHYRSIYVDNVYPGISGQSGHWQRNINAISPSNISDPINLGATATASAIVHLAATAGDNSFINTGNVGIGDTTPSYPLQVAGDIDASTGTYRLAGADVGQYFIDSAGSSSNLWSSDGSGRGTWLDVSGWDTNASDDSTLGNTVEEAELTISNAPVNGYTLQTDGSGNLTWVNPANLTASFWTQTNEQIYPSNSLWTDILVGGDSSASAKIVLEAATGYIKANDGDFQTLSGGDLNLSGSITADTLYLRDTNQSNTLQLNWNENDTNNHVLNLSVAGGDRYLTLTRDFTISGAAAGTLSFSNPSTLTVSASTQLNQNLLTTSSPTFTGLTVSGTLNDDLVPSGNGTLDLGTDLAHFRSIYVDNVYPGISGQSGYWQRNINSISPSNISDPINLGATATASATVHLAATAGDNSFINTGNVGIGTMNPNSRLEVKGSGTTSATSGLNVTKSDGTSVFSVRDDGFVQVVGSLAASQSINSGSYTIASIASLNYSGTKLQVGTGAFWQSLGLFTNGSEKFSIDTSGNVGIGDTTPDAALDVVGDTYISGGLSLYETAVSDGTIEATKFCTGDGETNCITDFAAISGGAGIWTDGGTYAYPTNGEVLGNAASAGANKIAGLYLSDSAPLTFGTDNDVSATFAGTELAITQGNNDINFDTNTLFIDGSANNVGIGDTTPNSLFTVGNGDLFQVNSSGIIAAIDGVAHTIDDVSGNLTLTSNSSTVSVADGLSVAGNILPSANDTYDLGSTTNRFKDLYLGGDTLHIGTSTTDEATIGYNTTTNILGIGTDSTTNGDIAFFTDDLYLDKSTGNVGIGNNAPAHTLHVSGNIGVNEYIYHADNANRDYLRFLPDQIIMVAGNDMIFSYNNGNLALGKSSPLYLQDGGKVGIGTTGPDAKLDSLSTTEQLRLTYTDGSVYTGFTVDSSGDLTIAPSGGDISVTGNLATNNLYIRDTDVSNTLNLRWNENDSANRILDFILGGGNRSLTINENFTIGNGSAGSITYSAPSGITVEGDTVLNQDLTTDASVVFSSLNLANGTLTSTNTMTLTPAAGSNLNIALATTGDFTVNSNQIFADTSTGGVGIGTNVPASKLHVSGGFGGNAAVTINQTLGGDIFTASASGTARMTLTNAGNLGLGVAIPSVRLEVDGAVLSDSSVGVRSGDVSSNGAIYLTHAGGANSGFLSWYTTAGTRLGVLGDSSTDVALTLQNSADFVVSGGNVGIGDTTPNSLFTVGNGDLFQVNSSGIIAAIDGVTHTIDDVSGNLTLTSNSTTVSVADGLSVAGNITSSADDTYDLGSNTNRFKDLYLGGDTLHIGTSTTDEATFSYNTSTNVLNIGTDSSTNGDIAFFTDDLYLDKSSSYVGFGTASPISSLHTAGTSATNLSTLTLENLSNASNTTKSISLDFRGRDTVNTQKLVSQVLAIPEDANWVSSALTFNTRLSDGAPAERMRITSTGNVGVGTTPDSDTKLHVVATGNRVARFFIPTMATNTSAFLLTTNDLGTSDRNFFTMQSDVDGTPDTEYTFRANGDALADGSWSGGGADFAEYFPTNDTILEPGFLVSLDSFNNQKVVRSAMATRHQLVGVVSTQAGFIGNHHDDLDQESNPNWKIVGLLGQVPTFVTNENGAIKPGDPITISSQAGIGAKANQAGNIVGRAMESYDAANPGKILVFVQPSWFDPSLTLTSTGDVQLQGNSQTSFAVTTPTGGVSTIAAFADAIIARIKAGFIETEMITAGTAVIENLTVEEINAEVITAPIITELTTVTASLSGEVAGVSTRMQYLEGQLANTVSTPDPASISAQISMIETKVMDLSLQTEASISALINELTISRSNDLTSSPSADLNLDVESIFISDFLSVLGDTILTNATVTNTLTLSSISSLDGKITFLSDLMTMDSFGSIVTINGNLAVKGILSAPVIDEMQVNIASISSEIASLSATVGAGLVPALQSNNNFGRVEIPATSRGVIIPNDTFTENSQIIVTLEDDYAPATKYWVTKDASASAFLIELDKTIDASVSASWLIMN